MSLVSQLSGKGTEHINYCKVTTLRYFSLHKMVRMSDLVTWDGKEVSIQNLSPGSLPHRPSVDNTNVPDLNSSYCSINLPQVDPKSTTSKNSSGKYVIKKA